METDEQADSQTKKAQKEQKFAGQDLEVAVHEIILSETQAIDHRAARLLRCYLSSRPAALDNGDQKNSPLRVVFGGEF